MKQAKFALTAVAVLAVIGGALAFKANRQGSNLFIQEQGKNQCTFLTSTPYVTTPVGVTIRASIASTTAPCPVLTVKADL